MEEGLYRREMSKILLPSRGACWALDEKRKREEEPAAGLAIGLQRIWSAFAVVVAGAILAAVAGALELLVGLSDKVERPAADAQNVASKAAGRLSSLSQWLMHPASSNLGTEDLAEVAASAESVASAARFRLAVLSGKRYKCEGYS